MLLSKNEPSHYIIIIIFGFFQIMFLQPKTALSALEKGFVQTCSLHPTFQATFWSLRKKPAKANDQKCKEPSLQRSLQLFTDTLSFQRPAVFEVITTGALADLFCWTGPKVCPMKRGLHSLSVFTEEYFQQRKGRLYWNEK